MTHTWIIFLLFFGLLATLIKPLGTHMANIYEGNHPKGFGWLHYFETLIYKILKIDKAQEMSWQQYALAMLIFNGLGIIALYLLQRMQAWLPLNPSGFPAVTHGLAFNTAISFATNTDWQSYSGEKTMSYLTQMAGLGVQNFLSASTGTALLIAVIRGFSRHQSTTIGNFWVDLTRTILYIFLPLSVVFSIILVTQGVPQTFKPPVIASLIQPFTDDKDQTISEQTIPLGPVASQVAIKQLGTNGGGFFKTNSAHPFENPTPLSNFLETLSILLIPAGLCYTFGILIKDTRQGWSLLASMACIFIILLAYAYYYESHLNPLVAQTIGEDATSHTSHNLEGKETRLSRAESILWAICTTATANGSVNCMHDSLMPLSGMITLLMLLFGEIIFGGVGSGLYGMLAFVIVAVFIAGLMVGRTPEYLGKKIESFEIKMAMLVLLTPAFLTLTFTAITLMIPTGKAGIFNPGPHGFSEVLYAFASASNNNGSAFAGIQANTPYYNILLGIAMLLGRYGPATAVLAMAGSLARKKTIPQSAGTLVTHTPLFITWLIAVIVLIGILNYLPVLALGPIVEHLLLKAGIAF